MDSILEVNGLNLSIPDRRLFSNLSFEIPRGSLTCITGENGVGKTTLMKHLLADLSRGYTGHVRFSVSRRQVQYVPQLRSVDDEYPLCIRDFAAFGLRSRHIFLNGREKRKLDGILAETNLVKIADRPLGRASGGEKQRAYLAQALCSDTKLLILDEATASLDRTSKHELLKMLRKVMKEHDLTIMFITHDPELIDAYADYELHLADESGKLIKKEGRN